MNSRTARILLVLGAFVAGLVLFTTVVFIFTGRSPAPIAMPSAVGGPFNLVDQNAKPITDQDMKGQPFLVFFGFTHCPDVCPTTLFEVSEIFRALGPGRRTTRAPCSSPSIRSATRRRCSRTISASFDPRVIGVTGDSEAIAAVIKAYRVYAKKVPTDGGGYTMDHTAIVYLMGKDGRFVVPFNMKRRPAEAAEDLKRYL